MKRRVLRSIPLKRNRVPRGMRGLARMIADIYGVPRRLLIFSGPPPSPGFRPVRRRHYTRRAR